MEGRTIPLFQAITELKQKMPGEMRFMTGKLRSVKTEIISCLKKESPLAASKNKSD